jgi:4-hydroxy-3-methylbut-2-enyl diphosphate reductase
MVDRAEDLDPRWLSGKQTVGVTAGASAPELLVGQVIDRLRALGATESRELDGISERVIFPLPKALA